MVFIGVFCCDEFGNVNGFKGKFNCGLFGYVKVDVEYVEKVVMLIEVIVGFLNFFVLII